MADFLSQKQRFERIGERIGRGCFIAWLAFVAFAIGKNFGWDVGAAVFTALLLLAAISYRR